MRQVSALSSAILALLCAAGGVRAQSVEFRVIERQGQVAVPSIPGATATTDAVLNYAIQARVVGGTATQFLGNFSFDLVASGEADSNGTLSRLATSAASGAYLPNATQTGNAGPGGYAGLAAIYTYLAGISPNFNGLINTSAGTFTNTPGNQEIGLITGAPTGNSLLLLTDLTDVPGTGDPDGNPDTYSGSGVNAPIDPTIAATYLGAGGNFVDVYRFKYTVSNTNVPAYRQLVFSLNNLTAQIAGGLQLSNGVWGPSNPTNASVSFTSVGIGIGTFPSPGAGAGLAMAALGAGLRRRRSVQ